MTPEESKKATQQAIEEAWHELGNGTKVKAKLAKKMEEKLEDLKSAAKAGNWKNQLEESIVEMISYNYSSSESLMWYGHLITQCQIKRDLTMPSPAGVRFMFNKYELFINPLLFGLYSTDEQIAILKHEMLHIINLHVIRQQDKHHKKWNYGTDLSINQLIRNIPEDGLQPEKFGFEKNMSAEQYYDLIPDEYMDEEKSDDGQSGGQGINESQSDSGEDNEDNDDIIDDESKLKDMISGALQEAQQGMIGNHDKWGESEGDADAAKEIVRQMAETATNKSRGMSPTECAEAIAMLKMKEQINWKKELRRIVGNRKAFSKLTIKKNDRRFPVRRDLRGKTKDHVADILVILDVSGSMSDEEILYGLNEIRAIAEKAGAGVKIMQVDTEPKLVEDFDPKAKTFNRRGYGGTFLYPAVKYAMENKIRFDAVVMITDGYIENSWDEAIPRVPFMWLVTQDKNNLSLDVKSYPRMKSYTLEIDKK